MKSSARLQQVDAPRAINLHKNRRLFDRALHRYITYGNLIGLVEEEIDFTISRRRDGQDLTRHTLINLMIERADASKQNPVLTDDFMRELIRLKAGGDLDLLRKILDQMAQTLADRSRLRAVP